MNNLRDNTRFYLAKLRGVIDGDTLDFQAFLGFGFSANIRARLFNVDAPEIKKVKKDSLEFKRGQIVKLEVKQWIFGYEDLYIIKAGHRDLYGRWICEIFRQDREKSLNQHLVDLCLKTTYKPWYHQEPLLDCLDHVG